MSGPARRPEGGAAPPRRDAAPTADAELLALWARLQDLPAADVPLHLLAVVHPGLTTAQLAAVPPARRDAQLLRWRRDRFGDRLPADRFCPACGQATGQRLAAVRQPAGDADMQPGTVAGQADADADSPPSGRAGDPIDAVLQALLVRCLAGSLPPQAVTGALAGTDPAAVPTAPLPVAVQCETCGHRSLQPLDVPALLQADIDAAAAGLLLEVHRLASVYHWSERDILALPAARRRFYLACQAAGPRQAPPEQPP